VIQIDAKRSSIGRSNGGVMMHDAAD